MAAKDHKDHKEEGGVKREGKSEIRIGKREKEETGMAAKRREKAQNGAEGVSTSSDFGATRAQWWGVRVWRSGLRRSGSMGRFEFTTSTAFS